MKKIKGRLWLSFILIGVTGQLAWTIENMYFNVFLYNTISTDPGYIASMVAFSAIAATLTTLFMGALSDKVGKRKIFICVGYVLWGLSTMSFGFINIQNAAKLFPFANAVSAAAITVIVMDCVMTFFGSTANDAAFNAYVTDMTNNENRGRAESVLAVFPLISMLLIFGLFDSMTQKGEWQKFFFIFGIAVIVAGIIAVFLLKESSPPKKDGSYFKNLFYGFSPSVMKENRMLYLAFCAFCLFSIAVQIFFPYLIIYMQNYLKIDSYAVVLGIVLIVASIVSVIGGKFIDKIGKLKILMPFIGVMALGLIGMFFARSFAAVIVAGSVMMSGYMLVTSSLSALIRDLTPTDKVGHFQGIRMIFAVLIPMVIGPFIGSFVIKNSASTYIDLGVVKNVPTPAVFLAAAVELVLVLIPFVSMKRRAK